MLNTSQFVNITWQHRDVDIEYQWVGALDERQPIIVFLHEGLGSVSMWKNFPQQLCESLNIRGLVYSRPGYGQSTPHPPHYRYSSHFMHEQAYEVLPSLLQALGVHTPVWLLGHSDGASIALLYASMHDVQGVIVLAPHLFVEDLTVSSIILAKQAYKTTHLRSKLSRHHLDVDSTFWCWSHIWLSPCFRGWSIESEVQHITAPVLAIQGQDDEYGTLHQIECLPKLIPNAHAVSLADCKHSPHRDQPLKTLQHCAKFLRGYLPRQIKDFP